jgi:hypothetical protein
MALDIRPAAVKKPERLAASRSPAVKTTRQKIESVFRGSVAVRCGTTSLRLDEVERKPCLSVHRSKETAGLIHSLTFFWPE